MKQSINQIQSKIKIRHPYLNKIDPGSTITMTIKKKIQFFFFNLALGDGIIKLTLIAENHWPAFGKAS